MPTCPIKHNNPECRSDCAWFRTEIGACAIWAIPELLANIAALRDLLEAIAKHLQYQKEPEAGQQTEIDLAEEL